MSHIYIPFLFSSQRFRTCHDYVVYPVPLSCSTVVESTLMVPRQQCYHPLLPIYNCEVTVSPSLGLLIQQDIVFAFELLFFFVHLRGITPSCFRFTSYNYNFVRKIGIVHLYDRLSPYTPLDMALLYLQLFYGALFSQCRCFCLSRSWSLQPTSAPLLVIYCLFQEIQ